MNIITITLNPAIDRTMYFDSFALDKTNKAAAKTEVTPGGKGINAARILKSVFGTDAVLFGISGCDGKLEELLDGEGIAHSFIQTGCDTRVNVKIISADGTQTEANERGQLSDRGAVTAFKKNLEKKLADETVDYIIIGGSFPQGVDKNVYNSIIKMSKKKKVKVALDCDGEALKSGIEEAPYIIKPNICELEELTGKKFSTKEQIADAAYALYVEKGVEIVTTMGADGAVYCGKAGKLFVNAPKVTVKGFSGAGDAFLASYLYTLNTTGSVKKALASASAVAAAKAESAGMPKKKRIAELKKQISVEELS